jgi:hypothetical protein
MRSLNMATESVEVIDIADRDRAVSTLALAFAADPLIRWFWPDPHPRGVIAEEPGALYAIGFRTDRRNSGGIVAAGLGDDQAAGDRSYACVAAQLVVVPAGSS